MSIPVEAHLDAPYLSVEISLFSDPITTAVSGPATIGLGVATTRSHSGRTLAGV